MRRQEGVTLVELLVTALILSGLTLVTARVVTDLRRNERVAFDDLMRLAERRLFGQILRNDLVRLNPSMNVVQIPSDPTSGVSGSDPYSSFFDLNKSLPCHESLPSCGRSLTLARPSSGEVSFSLLLDVPNSSGDTLTLRTDKTLDTSKSVSSKILANTLRKGDVLDSTKPRVYPPHQLFLLQGYYDSQVMRPASPGSSTLVDLCHCTGSRFLLACNSTSACGGSQPVPYQSRPAFVGFYDTPSEGFIFVSGSGAPLRDFHPSNPAIRFSGLTGIATFLNTLSDLQFTYKAVSLVRYSLKSNGELTRAEWKNAGPTGFEPGLTIATNVRKLVLRRPNISITIPTHEIDQYSTMEPKTGGSP